MSSVVRPPDPCLIAVALVVSSRSGSRFVYHYPPNPSIPDSISTQFARDQEPVKSDDSSVPGDEEGISSDDDEDTYELSGANNAHTTKLSSATSHVSDRDRHRSPSRTTGRLGGTRGIRNSIPQRKGTSGSDTDLVSALREETASSSGVGQVQWDSFLGLKCDIWEKLLSPSPSWHKRRFEVGVNDLTFVGWPVFVKRDGTWRKRKAKPSDKPGVAPGPESTGAQREATTAAYTSEPSGSDLLSGSGTKNEASTTGSPALGSTKPDDSSSDGSQSAPKGGMTMFNVVFVMNPPIIDYNACLKEMYENVIKKLGKALKSEQARANYVWQEAQLILNIKEKCAEDGSSVAELYSRLSSKSTLAQAIATIYTNISASKIASVTLAPRTSMSVQIPPLTSTAYLSTPNEPGYRGLWLTTADSFSAADESSSLEGSGSTKVLAKHFALLLLNDEATILKDVEASMSTIGPPLAHYIRSSKPTKSFAQISARSLIPLSDIQVLASHLVYWRRARAIPPLSKQDTYIVSPNADMSKLGAAAVAYEATFPTLPSLPKMLAALSGPPRPYFSFIPSRDHKEVYYEILAWLLRGAWVTQLRTFGWVKADAEIKMVVNEVLDREAREPNRSEEGGIPLTTDVQHEGGHLGRSNSDVEHEDHDTDSVSSSSSSSLDSEQSGEATPVPGHYGRQNSTKGNYQPENNPALKSSLILRPQRASPLESRWLSEILARFPDTTRRHSIDTDDSEPDMSLQKYWPLFTKYFNGENALEKISVREGLNQKLVSRVLSHIDINTAGPNGLVDPRERVLVTVRHW
ncbi:Nitrogen permease regulator 3 [Myotisia sp. PD_48]|nr:Nitrogen permease regulator 3 [Myotisia sp. PD_48]